MSFVPDDYTRRARIYPLMIVALPIGATTLAFFPEGFPNWKILWSLLTWCGGMALFAELGRDAGKRKEQRLFRKWGGVPTTDRLRYRGTANLEALRHRHAIIGALFPDLPFPATEEEETGDPGRADRLYERSVELLRIATRDAKRFRLLYEENCSYGFRRNLWGLKPFGLTTSVLGFVVAVFVGLRDDVLGASGVVAALAANSLLIALWVFVVSIEWVGVAANAYAERLLQAADSLAAD